MESNEFDGAFKVKAPVRASRRRQVQENEDEESVRARPLRRNNPKTPAPHVP